MRTTLTIDDDIAVQIEERRRLTGHSLKRVINGLLRAGMRADAGPVRAKAYRTPTYALGLRPGVDPAKLNQLVDELEAEAFQKRETRRSS